MHELKELTVNYALSKTVREVLSRSPNLIMATIYTDEEAIDLNHHLKIQVVELKSTAHVKLKNIRCKELIEVICETGSYELE